MTKSHSFIGWIAGILSTVIGGLLLFWLTTGQQAQLTSTSINPPTPAVSPMKEAMVDFEITNQLGEGQVTEQVAVVIDGRSVGTLTVDVVHRTASLTVTVPRPGRHEYKVSSTTILEDEFGTTYQRDGYGVGYLQVTSGRSYALWGNYEIDPIGIELR